MMRMANLFENGRERCLFSFHLTLKKASPIPQLPRKNSGTSLPRQGRPREEWRFFTLCGPVFTLQRVRQSGDTGPRYGKNLALRPLRPLLVRGFAQEPQPRQFLQGVIYLGPRNPRPILHLTPRQFRIRLIT